MSMRVPMFSVLVSTFLVWFISTSRAWAIIDPKVTPVQLVVSAQSILAGQITATAPNQPLDFHVTQTLKGPPAASPLFLDLSQCRPADLPGVSTALQAANGQLALLFISAKQSLREGILHVGGSWLGVIAGDNQRWRIQGIAVAKSAIYSGGTDMLDRMVRQILQDPGTTVPVSAGAVWMPQVGDLGKVQGRIAGLESLELGEDQRIHLFVACDLGDRLLRGRNRDEAFDDVTAEVKLASRSLRYVWMDITGTGQPSLVSWDGTQITAWTTASAAPWSKLPGWFPWSRPCLGLSACCLPGTNKPAVLISTLDVPVLLHRDASGKWLEQQLPIGQVLSTLGAATSPCIVADLDNDSWWDVLQPRVKGAVLWKGTSAGLAQPVRCDVNCADGLAQVAVGDFDQDGILDIFLAGTQANQLWENDGHAGFKAVGAFAGSLSYKASVGLSGCGVADLNHDGRPDLYLLHPDGAFTYHFNRGFRCFGEEGELRLKDEDGQVAAAVADFNADGSLDLAIAFADGRLRCYYNDCFNKALLRIGLAPGLPGPVTASVWQGQGKPVCMGTLNVTAGSRGYVALRNGRKCTIKWSSPGMGSRSHEITLPDDLPANGLCALLGEEPQPAPRR